MTRATATDPDFMTNVHDKADRCDAAEAENRGLRQALTRAAEDLESAAQLFAALSAPCDDYFAGAGRRAREAIKRGEL
jgi:hypothetical protein